MTAPAENAKKKTKSRKSKAPLARGKRKEAVARAVLTKGTGKVYYNEHLLSTLTDAYLREVIAEALDYYPARNEIDIHVTVNGGGKGGQAQAARTAIAKVLVESAPKNEEMRTAMLRADRSLLVEDPRRVEPKKFKGPKARARFTKSYR